MPLMGFICPDRQKVDKEVCFEKCRMDERCHTLTELYDATRGQPQNNIFSVTQLLQPLRVIFLLKTKPYYINLKANSEVGSIEGYKIHHQTSNNKGRRVIDDGNDIGEFDSLEVDSKHEGSYVLTEVKTQKNYPKIDPQRDSCKFKNVALQLNNYRIKLENNSKPISRMQIKLVLRETPSDNGDNVRFIDIPRLPDDYVIAYFRDKKAKLLGYIANNEIPPPCNSEESWEGLKCRDGNCRVWEFCEIGIEANGR